MTTPPPPPPRKMVTHTGISGGVHTAHLIATICTGGLWGPIWLLHWLLSRRKTTTRYE